MTERPVIHFRCPKALRDHLKETAEQQGVSMNSLLLALVAGAVGFTLANGDDD